MLFCVDPPVWMLQAKNRAMSRLHSIMDWFAGAKGGLDAAALDSKMTELEWVEKEMRRGGHVIQKVLIPSLHLKEKPPCSPTLLLNARNPTHDPSWKLQADWDVLDEARGQLAAMRVCVDVEGSVLRALQAAQEADDRLTLNIACESCRRPSIHPKP